jgi:hypothetical protein
MKDQGDTEKKDIPPPPVAVAVAQPVLPPPPLGSLGLPSAGIEAGASNKTDAVEQVSIDKPTPDPSIISAPKPRAEVIQPEQKTGLAFALRLADLTPNREVHLAQAVQQPAPQAQAVQPDLKAEPAVVLPVIAPQAESSPPVPPQPTADIATTAPIKQSQPAQQPAAAATPIIAIAPTHQESGSHLNDGGGASGKETPKHFQPQPTADLKSFRQASATPEIVSSLPRETLSQTTAATPIAATSAPLAPAPASSVAAAAPTARVSM